ncbi:biotin-dependent carboxyltransferase family protein [Cohnella ginsengisoli]|uniref:Biotin-dependent carboxyltransferase family protein n=1 Tax=Cohnella ginsengisoli TaxID=425004 RepID=A0A9X4QNE0_9BACL|nr:biotin-dependent carboxyltransferase family protein [Cohnella ginsengisoli]MDG0792471.1 biotin-dependent carboxyltransferase family protein [Cohnella ginsengisoli]
MSMIILKPGLLTTVQDLGRYGAQQFGVIVAGAMDAFALRISNLLVGNDENAAGLEITMVGPEIYFAERTLISVCGGDLSPVLNDREVPLWKTVVAPEGSLLRFGRVRLGCRAYLAVAGGVDAPVRMNSRSTYLRAGIGGWEGRSLQKGDRLPVGAASPANRALTALLADEAEADGVAFSRWSVAPDLLPSYTANPEVRAVPGQEAALFEKDSAVRFLNETYQIRTESDRMGYRLTGEILRLREKRELASAAVTFGTVQVPPDGQPIVLMADRQTIGGYPKIAQVASVDLALLAQANLGERIRFRSVSWREAQRLYLIRENGIRMLRSALAHINAGVDGKV